MGFPPAVAEMTDELLNDLCDSILFMRDAMALHKGALVRHLQSNGVKSVERFGYRFGLRHIKGCDVCGAQDREDLRVERIKEG